MNISSNALNVGRLRVVHLLPSFGVGGAEQMAAHLMIALSESHDVHGVGLGPSQGGALEERLSQAGIPLRFLGKQLGFHPRLYGSLSRIFREIRPHVVHTHLGVLRYALPGLLRRRVPLTVHTLHNLAEYENDLPGRAVQWLAFRLGVLPVAISQKVAASVTRVYGIQCRNLVPNCIPVDEYRGNLTERVRWRAKEGFEGDAVLFTCVGRLEPQKNPLLMVQSFAALNETRAHLVLMGEGSLRNQLATYITERGLDRRVHLLGKRDEIPACLAASDVFVLSSDWEGSPLAVMEAMAAGLPVISTAVGGVPELVASGRHGILVSPGDGAALTEAMRALNNNPSLRAAMAGEARAHAIATFSVDRMARGYASIYRAALMGNLGDAVSIAA